MSEQKITFDPDLKKRIFSFLGTIPDLYLFVNISTQTLFLIQENIIATSFPVSTSRYGTGNKVNSFKTPVGIHRIVDKIGAGALSGSIFKDREDTGKIWNTKNDNEDNLILSRILRLEGLEPDINRGPDIDSYERYIYIHGTDKENKIGTPNSHGCICLRNDDIIQLFDCVPEKTIVIIA